MWRTAAGHCRALKRKLAEAQHAGHQPVPGTGEVSINIASANPYARQRSVEYYMKCLTFANELESPTVQFFAG